MTQTAVEWLIDQVEDFIGLIPVDIIEQAKKMEKNQMILLVQQLKDYTRESNNILGYDEREAEEFVDIYYTQTYTRLQNETN